MEHRVSLDCVIKGVTLRTEEDSKVVVIGERRDYLSNVISVLVVERLVRKGCEAYLVLVSDFTLAKLTVSDIRSVRDFPDVFPNELPGVAPTHKAEFSIDLLMGTISMSIAPYRMVLRSWLN